MAVFYFYDRICEFAVVQFYLIIAIKDHTQKLIIIFSLISKTPSRKGNFLLRLMGRMSRGPRSARRHALLRGSWTDLPRRASSDADVPAPSYFSFLRLRSMSAFLIRAHHERLPMQAHHS